jgi:hypothetical protein
VVKAEVQPTRPNQLPPSVTLTRSTISKASNLHDLAIGIHTALRALYSRTPFDSDAVPVPTNTFGNNYCSLCAIALSLGLNDTSPFNIKFLATALLNVARAVVSLSDDQQMNVFSTSNFHVSDGGGEFRPLFGHGQYDGRSYAPDMSPLSNRVSEFIHNFSFITGAEGDFLNQQRPAKGTNIDVIMLLMCLAVYGLPYGAICAANGSKPGTLSITKFASLSAARFPAWTTFIIFKNSHFTSVIPQTTFNITMRRDASYVPGLSVQAIILRLLSLANPDNGMTEALKYVTAVAESTKHKVYGLPSPDQKAPSPASTLTVSSGKPSPAAGAPSAPGAPTERRTTTATAGGRRGATTTARAAEGAASSAAEGGGGGGSASAAQSSDPPPSPSSIDSLWEPASEDEEEGSSSQSSPDDDSSDEEGGRTLGRREASTKEDREADLEIAGQSQLPPGRRDPTVHRPFTIITNTLLPNAVDDAPDAASSNKNTATAAATAAVTTTRTSAHADALPQRRFAFRPAASKYAQLSQVRPQGAAANAPNKL